MGDTIWLQRPSEEVPWGFRLQGGKDFQQPLTVQRVTSGSIAASNLSSGDVILRIGEAETALLTHAQAMLQIKTCGNALELRVSKGGVSTGITSPKVGNYSLPPQADALHEFTTESNTGSWPQISDSQGDYSPRNTSRSLHPLSPPESETGWHSQPGFLRQTSGGTHSPKAPIHQQNNQVSEPPFAARNYESAQPGFQASPPVVVIDDQIEGGLGYHANAPPAPPPLPPISSPSAATVQPWKRQNSQPQPRSYEDSPAAAATDNYASSSYPFGVPSKYSNDSGFGQGSPVSNGQQTFGGGADAGGGYPSGGDYDYDTSSYPVEAIQTQQKAAQSPQRMPDAILNMAAKGEGDKKPFSYIADVNAIKEQRDRVRKKTPVCALPRYQHMLNMPQFDDPPRVRNALRTTPSTPPALQNPDSGDAVVANLQFNTPLGLYSNDNVVEALKGQTGGSHVSDVVGLSPKQDKTDITQSPVYKMIHGIDQPKAKPVVKFVEAQPSARENTGGSEVDTSSIRRNITGDDSDSGQYDEKSLRYTGKNIPSKSFRLLQSMTGGARAGDSTPPTAHRQIQLREPPSSDDETRYSGHQNRSSDVPSKTFQRLQIRTGATGPTPHSPAVQSAPGTPQGGGGGGSEIDRTSIRQNLNLGDDLQDAGEYEQTSIRYTGRNIPSKSFRMLQSMTGGSGSESSPPPGSSHPGRRQQQQQRRPPQQQQQQYQQQQHQYQQQEPEASDGQNPDEPVDIRYVGGHIPSQSFKMLQHSIGASASPARETVDGGAPSDTLASSQGRRVKVVRLRQQASQEDSGSTDF